MGEERTVENRAITLRLLALFGHGAMSDLCPLRVPKQTSADSSNLRVRALAHRLRVRFMPEIGALEPLRQIGLAGRRLQHDVSLDQRIDAVGGTKRFFQ
jgi:hypothetical protein